MKMYMWKRTSMNINTRIKLDIKVISLVLVLLLNACAAVPKPGLTVKRQIKVQNITNSLKALSPTISPEEAQQIAKITVYYPLQLAKEYRLTKPPLMHNALVNLGSRTRGLCFHWAKDLLNALEKQKFKTVDLYWAIANKGSITREHSSVVVTAKKHNFYSGVVFDGWRDSGILYWKPVKEDLRYDWRPYSKSL